ncbi:MAG: Polynucleotide 5'-hydroxyl-kinase grc3 [Chrysothrix sp. TS-e1954]|nr:MAG: Polynucleotide 5'-hydroxyl-kinase grc3 [Chrysothrix sp. TS-e1954]
MGKKRKVDAMRAPAAGAAEPQVLSAFAAAKARQLKDATSVSSAGTHQTSGGREDPALRPPDEDPQVEQAIYESASEDGQHEVEQEKAGSGVSSYKLSTWKPAKDNVHKASKDNLVITLDPGEYVTFLGQYDLRVHSGSVEVCGAVLRTDSRSVRVIAPANHPLPKITCTLETESRIELTSCWNNLEGLAVLSPLCRRIWPKALSFSGNVSATLFQQIHQVSFYYIADSNDSPLRILKPLDIASQWQELSENLTRPNAQSRPRSILVCGAATHAKSTFCRVLVNRFLTSKPTAQLTACLIDLESSLPEFSPAGQLSLVQIRTPILGPPFTHPFTDSTTGYRTLKAHSITSLSPKEDPEHYLACAADLIDHYQLEVLPRFPQCPLIIKYPGWSRSAGQELMKRLISSMPLTNIVSTDDLPITNLTDHIPHHSISSSTPSTTPAPLLSTKDLRTLQELSYFHQADPLNGHLQWDTRNINNRTRETLDLRFASDDCQLLGCMMLGQQPTDEFYWTVLDGSLVGIVLVEDATYAEELCGLTQRTQEHGLPYFPCDETALTHPPDPRRSRLLGHGICTSIDAAAHTLKLQTPVRLAVLVTMQEVAETGIARIVLVKGNLEAPGWAYLEATLPDRHGEVLVDEETAARHAEEDRYIAQQLGSEFGRQAVGFDQDCTPWLSELSVGRGTAKIREEV